MVVRRFRIQYDQYIPSFSCFANLFQKPLGEWNNSKIWERREILAIYFFSIRVFFHRHWRLTGQQGKGGDHFLFHSTTSTRSRTFRHLFATLHVRWQSHTFSRNACILPDRYSLRFSLLIELPFDWWCEVCVFSLFLPDDLVLDFCYSNLGSGNRWTRARIDHHPCITSEPTNQVC